MKRLDMEASDVKKLAEVNENEALEFLSNGVVIICRVHPREFLELKTSADLLQCKKLKEAEIYDNLKFFLN